MFIVLSGLPGSGKTTLARPLSTMLRLPLLDKDDLLQTLLTNRSRFAGRPRALESSKRRAHGEGGPSVLRRGAVVLLAARVAVRNLWHTNTVAASPPGVVEVLCDCPPGIAAERFHARVRHPGHHDSSKSFADSLWRYEQLAATLPLDVGPVVRVDTSRTVDVAGVLEAVRPAAG